MVGSSTVEHKAQPSRSNCLFLLGCLVALVVAFPFLEDVAKPLVLVVPLAAVFVAGVVAADANRRHVRNAIIIAVVQIGLTLLCLALKNVYAGYLATLTLALLTMVGLILFATYCVLGYVLRARVITRDQIYAGICMYLMIGFAFGAVFYLIYILDPNSFIQNTQGAVPGQTPDLMYFSFVTLATLGYGDITPRTNLGRSLAVFEALSGMIYIAVFMARLVSLRSATGE